ncbi:MAG: hypothetical protein JSS02_04690, partial [Planctomycetes bacterium]|nr:hypothetical protein [Planctomycetota bacterium]
GSQADWIALFKEWTETRGWQRSSDWSQGHESWAARFTGADRHWIDIRLARDGRGALSGVLQVVPESPE